MRIFLFMMMAISLMAAERFSIEVLSVVKTSDINSTFMQKVNETDLSFTTHHTQGKYRVLVGDFSSIQKAEKELPRVKRMVSLEAFVTTGMDIVEMNPKEKMIKATILAKAKALKKPKEEPSQTIGSVEVKGQQEKGMQKIANNEKGKKEVFCTSSKKSLREAQIEKALAFYRNSSFYSFK